MGDDKDKIFFILSYLKGSTADKYKQNWLDIQRDSDTNEILINNSFCLFMRELDRAFTPVNKCKDTQKWLEDLIQGSQNFLGRWLPKVFICEKNRGPRDVGW